MTEKDHQEEVQDRMTDVIASLVDDGKFREFLELMEYHYVYMACHVPGDPYTTAFREGQREMAAMICGINKRVIAWQNKTAAA